MNAETRPTAILDWSLFVDCPKCEESFDIVKQDSDGDYIIAKAVFSNQWDDVAGCEVTCPKCEHEFQLAGIEY